MLESVRFLQKETVRSVGDRKAFPVRYYGGGPSLPESVRAVADERVKGVAEGIVKDQVAENNQWWIII